jgi:hypothetical protein
MRIVPACCTVLAVLVAGCGGGRVERSLDDPAGDVAPAGAPDVVGVSVERDDDAITFRVRFATAPPLGVSADEGWIDMLLIGIDVPPLGPAPVAPGGEWRGLDYALGTHGPSRSGMLVRLTGSVSERAATPEKRADVPIEIDDAALSLSVPAADLGDAESFALSLAAAREWNEARDEPAGARPDVVPDSGTWTVELGERGG